eukprot:929886-Pyramimonas_sp.AAC.1
MDPHVRAQEFRVVPPNAPGGGPATAALAERLRETWRVRSADDRLRLCLPLHPVIQEGPLNLRIRRPQRKRRPTKPKAEAEQ